ncbi:MAG: polysaccharide deacetylase family protein [Anaerolineae bacterium]
MDLTTLQGISGALHQRLPRLGGADGALVLMYHAFGAPGEAASRYVVPRRRFAQQMAYLLNARYHVISVAELVRRYQANEPLPARSVAITIDDGYLDNLTVAYQVLRRQGFPATIFAVSGALGGCNNWDPDGTLAGRPLLSLPNLQAMQRGGIEIGAHTRTHPALTTLGPERLRDEVEGSRADLERGLGVPVATFSYPHGRYNAAVAAAVARAGYLAGFTVEEGVNTLDTDRYALRRIEVFGTDTLPTFALKLWRGRSRLFYQRRPRRRAFTPAVNG